MSENNGYISPFIGDGYDESATIPAVPGKWSEVKINYRCMSADEESETAGKCRLFPNDSRVRHFSRLFATKIVGWNIKTRDGKPLPIDADTIAGLSPQFYDTLHAYIDGTMPSDTMKATLEAEIKNS
jgi:hypothetical protein